MQGDLDTPHISVRDHVREVIAAERRTYRVLARVFAQNRDGEYTGAELSRLLSTLGEEDKDRVEREIGARS
jgi:hypothetical protein